MNKNETAKERQRQINKLLAVSTPEERAAIERGRRAGRKLRKELESAIA